MAEPTFLVGFWLQGPGVGGGETLDFFSKRAYPFLAAINVVKPQLLF